EGVHDPFVLVTNPREIVTDPLIDHPMHPETPIITPIAPIQPLNTFPTPLMGGGPLTVPNQPSHLQSLVGATNYSPPIAPIQLGGGSMTMTGNATLNL